MSDPVTAGQGASAAPAATDNPGAPNTQTPSFDYKTGIAPEHHSTWEKKGWSSPNDVLKSYANLENMLGAPDRVILPKDDDEAAWGEVWNKMGRPKTHDEYKFDDLPNGEKRDEDMSKWFRETAHKLGFSQKQASALDKAYNDMAAVAQTKQQMILDAQVSEANAKLKSEWGNDFETNMAIAKSAAKRFGGDEIAAAVDALSDKAGAAAVAKLFHAIGTRMGESKFVEGDQRGSGANASMPKESALKEIQEVMADPDYLNGSKNPARHEMLKRKATELFDIAYKDEPLPGQKKLVNL